MRRALFWLGRTVNLEFRFYGNRTNQRFSTAHRVYGLTLMVSDFESQGAQVTDTNESAAAVLERELTPTIERWINRVDKLPALSSTPLSYQERTGHLPRLLKDVIMRLRTEEGATRPKASAARDHGKVRFDQGYSIPMLVEESRLLQVSIFDTLRLYQSSLDPDQMMQDVMTIADECDVQLKHTLESYMDFGKVLWALKDAGPPSHDSNHN